MGEIRSISGHLSSVQVGFEFLSVTSGRFASGYQIGSGVASSHKRQRYVKARLNAFWWECHNEFWVAKCGWEVGTRGRCVMGTLVRH